MRLVEFFGHDREEPGSSARSSGGGKEAASGGDGGESEPLVDEEPEEMFFSEFEPDPDFGTMLNPHNAEDEFRGQTVRGEEPQPDPDGPELGRDDDWPGRDLEGPGFAEGTPEGWGEHDKEETGGRPDGGPEREEPEGEPPEGEG
jgi:hypothetical protein